METLTKTEIEIKAYKEKLPNHFNVGNCDLMDKPLDNFDRFIEKDNFLFELVTVVPNNSKKCAKKHNGNIAIYHLVNGAIGYDL